MKKNKLMPLLLAALLLLAFFVFGSAESQEPLSMSDQVGTIIADTPALDAQYDSEAGILAEDGSYTTKEDVALYIHSYGRLPGNFVTKEEARAAGWEGGGLDEYLPGMCIGGDRFGNREGLLPDAPGRVWTECDINTLGADSRGAERIVFSNDGLIYYTGDHYESFELLYD